MFFTTWVVGNKFDQSPDSSATYFSNVAKVPLPQGPVKISVQSVLLSQPATKDGVVLLLSNLSSRQLVGSGQRSSLGLLNFSAGKRKVTSTEGCVVCADQPSRLATFQLVSDGFLSLSLSLSLSLVSHSGGGARIRSVR